MELLDRIKYYSNPSNIHFSHNEEMASILGLDDTDRLNFEYPAKIATLFQVKLDSIEYEQVMDLLADFYNGYDARIDQGVKSKIVKFLKQRKDYSKRDIMTGLSKGRGNLRYKLQLHDHDESQFITNVQNSDFKWQDYFKPDFSKQYWHNIAKVMIDGDQDNYISRIKRLVANYEDSLVPLLKNMESLHEYGDAAQLQTSRIVRIPSIDETTTFGRLLLEHRSNIKKIKGHKYDQDHLHIGFYLTMTDLIMHLEQEQKSLDKQEKRLGFILGELSYSELAFKNTTPNQRADLLFKVQKLATGLNGAESDIKQSGMGNKSWKIDRDVMNKIKNGVIKQLYSNKEIKEKNKLHIESLQKYSI